MLGKVHRRIGRHERWRRTAAGAVGLAILAMSSGCGAIAREVVAQQYMTTKPGMTVNLAGKHSWIDSDGPDELVIEWEDVDSLVAGRVCGHLVSVSYPKDVPEEAATRIVAVLDKALAHVATELGMNPAIKPELTLHRLEAWPKQMHYTGSINTRESTAKAILPFVGDEGSAWGVFGDERSLMYTAVFIHELVETQLGMPWYRPTAMVDVGLEHRFYSGPIVFGTRWFRDGFANCAAIIACESILADLRKIDPHRRLPAPALACTSTLSALAIRRADIFRWHQYSEDSTGMYEASTGLFLLLEHRYGRSAIRKIVAEMDKLERPDGAAIEKVCDRVLGTSLRGLVDEFSFPTLGFTPSTENGGVRVECLHDNGPAVAAGLHAGISSPPSTARTCQTS